MLWNAKQMILFPENVFSILIVTCFHRNTSVWQNIMRSIFGKKRYHFIISAETGKRELCWWYSAMFLLPDFCQRFRRPFGTINKVTEAIIAIF